MPKSYRIRTEVGVDKYINVNLEQDWESLEILSLKILADDLYTRFCADYGVVVGRVFVNNGFGLPKAKVSVFIPLEDADELDPVISELYPYKTITDTNEAGYRYNLLPKLPSYNGHQSTGSFPNVGDVLMDESYIEVYDKYYRYTVTTNESGDFMIFGVPIGNQTIVMDVDLSDIGCFSLSPQDLIQQGLATETQVNGSTFRTSTNLRELPQIKNLVFDVDVRPFWGDAELCQVGITRVDFDLTKQANINIQPTSIFMGSIISTTDDDALKVSCKPKNNTGNLCELVSGPGEIKSVRQTINTDSNGLPLLEVYDIEEEGKVIDGDGTFLMNVPMNLDYVFTNEFGQQVLSDDPSKGIPTKGKYRFKFKWQNDQGLQGNFQRADFLVPNVKEYGWTGNSDPFNQNPTTFTYPQIPIGSTTGTTYTSPSSVGLSNPVTINVESYSIYINGVVYTGTLNSITLNQNDTLLIVATPVDPTQAQDISFTEYPLQLFKLLKSYAFSTDWDDYVNPQEAIDCEDTFYEFKYNKVYTTAMFLDRYKNGVGRAKHLGIKEIDNRTCKSTVNTFPVNDIIRNFDFIFFVFNILINILTFPILVLLFVAHLIALLWPILKYLLLFLGPFIIAMGVQAGVDLAYYIAETFAFTPLGGPVVNFGTYLQIIAKGIYALALVAAGVVFTIFYTKFFKESLDNGRVSNFPRIGLPMIAYPDCTSCDCQCGNATIEDGFDENDIQQEIQDAQDDLGDSSSGFGYDITFAEPNTVLAPLSSPITYEFDHPNLQVNQDGDDPYDCGGASPIFKSLQTLIGNDDIVPDLAVRAVLDFKRLASGYDVLSSTDPNAYYTEFYLLHAPQPFLFSGKDSAGSDERFFGYPTSVTLPQKLNDFNTRDKYFYSNTSSAAGTGVNRIKTTVNPGLSSNFFEDQVLVVLMNAGTASQIGVGGVCTFQDPKYTDSQSSNRLINLTGATTNQFNNTAITGTTLTGQTSVTINYANPSNPNASIPVTVPFIQPSISQLPVAGNPTVEQSYLQYATDVEYFQLITGITVSDFETNSGYNGGNSGYFPSSYLFHNITYRISSCGAPYSLSQQGSISDVLRFATNYQNYEVCIFVRGVDPFSAPQTIKYDLSKIFGNTNYGTVTVEGSYYLNQPIQALPTGLKPTSHNTTTNSNTTLYFPSFTFTPDQTQFTAFTSNLPYFYSSIDDTISSSYIPAPIWSTNSTQTSGGLTTLSSVRSVPLSQTSYMVGGSYLAWWDTTLSNQPFMTTDNNPPCNQDCQKTQYFNTNNGSFVTAPNNGNLTALYSPAYYRYIGSGSLSGPIQFNLANYNRIVMRSDRLPTSTGIQNGANLRTGYLLHQNDNFSIYTLTGVLEPPTINTGGDLPNGDGLDSDSITSGLTSSLTCEGMVPLECYSGSGSNVGIIPSNQCSIPTNRMINGCYCLLNRRYVKEYGADVRLFLEWKVRFTMNFAACRGVFAQVFQNNWINGVLYMYSFNKRTTFGLDPTNPTYNYCEDVIIFNDLTNNFFYRSSPWNEQQQKFIGKQSPAPPNIPAQFLVFPGLGYNVRQIQFPTTIVDMGPRDSFINEICCSGVDGFGSYFADQLKATSYQDNSDIIQLGFLSRILNEGVRQRIIPIGQGQNNTEGKGIEQFFNSDRGGYRIDGDWAQMLSINSEWKVLPFITENVPSNSYIYFGDNLNGLSSGVPSDEIKPILGLFFTANTPEIRYRKIMSPGIETYNFNPLIEEKFGYGKSQVVPHYKWWIKTPTTYVGTPNIFGSEDNNWYTQTYSSGFFQKKYQDLDFTTLGEKYMTTQTKYGYIASFNLTGGTMPITPLTNILQGDPSTNSSNAVVVGAPYHFYFGLNNGKTAIDRFYKLYVATQD